MPRAGEGAEVRNVRVLRRARRRTLPPFGESSCRLARCQFLTVAFRGMVMARIIWSSRENPTRAVARALGVRRPQLGDAIHAIKKNARLRPRDNVSIGDDGSVMDAQNEVIGNIYDEI